MIIILIFGKAVIHSAHRYHCKIIKCFGACHRVCNVQKFLCGIFALWLFKREFNARVGLYHSSDNGCGTLSCHAAFGIEYSCLIVSVKYTGVIEHKHGFEIRQILGYVGNFRDRINCGKILFGERLCKQRYH